MSGTCSTLVAVVGRRLRRDGRAADTGRLKVKAAPAVRVFLGANPRPAKMFLDTGIEQIAGRASRRRRWGCDGASLENVSESLEDIMSRIGSISDSTGGLASYDYLGAGTVASVSYPEPGLSLDYSADNFAAWDQFGEVLNQAWKEGSTTVDGYSYTYSQSGNRLTRANATDAVLSESYGYDGLDRLTSVACGDVGSQTQTESWTLDGLGNFMDYNTPSVSQTRTTDAANEIQTITQNNTPANTQGYDAAGNMTTIADPNNANGTLTCTFDAWNRLAEVQDSNGNIIAKYQFDGSGRLVEELSDFSGTTPGTVTYSFYDGQNAIETSTGAATSSPGSLSPQYQYVFSPAGGKTPILWDSTFDSETGAPTSTGRLYFTSDANTNVTGLVDASGQVVERYIYSAYGQVTFCDASWTPLTTGGTNTTTPGSSSAYGNTTLYASMVLDPRTGLFYDEHRWYDAWTSTFVSQDPALADSNMYRYCGNDPVVYVDPSGLASTQWQRKLLRAPTFLDSAGTVGYDMWVEWVRPDGAPKGATQDWQVNTRYTFVVGYDFNDPSSWHSDYQIVNILDAHMIGSKPTFPDHLMSTKKLGKTCLVLQVTFHQIGFDSGVPMPPFLNSAQVPTLLADHYRSVMRPPMSTVIDVYAYRPKDSEGMPVWLEIALVHLGVPPMAIPKGQFLYVQGVGTWTE
jgi:RHS repeat-associated protein